jgi:MYXO-CTERM domain-containing protein
VGRGSCKAERVRAHQFEQPIAGDASRRPVCHTAAVHRTWTLGVALLPSLLASPAFGHGTLPQTREIAFHPSDPSTIVVRTTFGLLVSEDDGESWSWVCRTVIGSRDAEDPATVVMSNGAVLMGLFDGLLASDPRRCSFDFPSADLADRVVIDVARDPSDASSAFAVTSDGLRVNGVFRTDDDGATFSPVNAEIESILFERLRIAPSRPARMLLSGAFPPTATEPRRPFVHRSDDAGETWTAMPFEEFTEGDDNIFVLGIDPTDPDHVFMKVWRREGDDRLIESTDGGETWIDRLVIADLAAFAWSADGSTIAVGGPPPDGLHRSVNGGETFEQVDSEIDLACASFRGSELWICANDYVDDFAIGVSSDGGDTFTPRLHLRDIEGVVECDEGSEVTSTCEPELVDLRVMLGLDAGVAGDGGIDAGTRDGGTSPSPPKTGCGCAPVGSRSGWPIPLAILALALRRRR